MKPIYTTLLTLLMATSLMATNIKAKTNGNWLTNGTWDKTSPARIPQDNDTIIIPLGDTVALDQNLDLNNVTILIYGVLNLSNGKLRLDAASNIIVETTGKITGINHNDQVRIDNVLKFDGSQGVQTGYSYADVSTGTGFVSVVVLPVQFQTFYVSREGSNSQLNWSTSNETNNSYYAIERSSDARTWKQVAVIMGAGTSAMVNKYSYTDKNINDAVIYYRIRQVDMGGTSLYSAIRSLRISNNTITNIYTSSYKTVTIDFNSDVKDNVSIQLINMSGQVIVRKQFSQASYRLIVDAMSAGSGVYAVQVSDGKGWSEVKKIAL